MTTSTNNLSPDDEEYKAALAEALHQMVDECIFGEGKHGIFVLGDPAKSTVSVYALNANFDETRVMLMTAAEPYVFHPVDKRVVN